MPEKIDKELVRRRFSKHLAAYDSLAVVQQWIAGELARDFSVHAPERIGAALEVGCGTGFLTRELLKTVPIERLYINDIVEEALPALQQRLRKSGLPLAVASVPGDAEHTPFPDGLDLVASASVMQWFDDLPGFFRKTAECLRPGGWFVFNLFGPKNLHQIKALTGTGLNYRSPRNLRDLLEKRFRIAGFRRETISQEFDTPFDVLRHLQQTGVTATGEFRWTPGRLRAFEREYTARYSIGTEVYLDWDVIYVIARR